MAVFQLQEVFNITGKGPIPVGHVVKGPLKVGMKTNLENYELEIKEMEMHHKKIEEANTGDNVAIFFTSTGEAILKLLRKNRNLQIEFK